MDSNLIECPGPLTVRSVRPPSVSGICGLRMHAPAYSMQEVGRGKYVLTKRENRSSPPAAGADAFRVTARYCPRSEPCLGISVEASNDASWMSECENLRVGSRSTRSVF